MVLVCALVCHGSDPVILSGRAMGTNWTVKFVPPAAPVEREAITRRVSARLEELEQQFSTYRADSELSRFNANRGPEWIPVSAELARVAMDSRAISELTGGAFDPTVGPLVRLWGFSAQRRVGALPTEAEIATARERVGWRDLEARGDSPALRKARGEIAADFSSMAKGFASDEIGRLLGAAGVENFFVQIAGDVKCGGLAGDGRPWRVGIEEPRDAGPAALACVVALANQALSTSGDYRNFFLFEGRRYGHIIDPRTGRPASTGLAVVSVVDASCARSSALATALFVLGPDAAFELAVRERIAALLILRDGARFTPRATPEFERLRRETELSSLARR